MKLQNKFQYIANPVKVFMAVLVILCLLSILQGICISIENTYAREKHFKAEKTEAQLTDEEQRIDRIKNSKKEFLPDGTIHLIDRVEHISDQIFQEQIYDSNDNLLWEGPSDKRPYEYLSWAKHLRRYKDGFNKAQMKDVRMITTDFSRNVRVPVQSDNRTEQIWRYHSGVGYFKGYNASGEPIGYTGTTGFSDSKSEVKPFGEFGLFAAWCPQDASSPTLLWQTQRRIYQINFEKQEVETIFESTDSDIEALRTNLHAWRDLKPGEDEYIDHNKYRPLIHCQTRDGKHHLILREPNEQLSFNLRSPSFTATKQEILVCITDSNTPPIPDNKNPKEIDNWVEEIRNKSWIYSTKLSKVDNQGDLELLNSYDWIRPSIAGFVNKARDPRPVVKRYVSQFSPPLYDLIMRLLGRKILRSVYAYENRGDFFYGSVKAILEIRPYRGLINRILSGLMMVFVFWHGWPRRTSWAKFIFWLVFTGLFNIVGLLTYLALNHTAVIKCPACGKRRGLAQVDCVRCKAQLPAPERGKFDLIFSV